MNALQNLFSMHHADAVTGGVIGILGGAGFATGAIPLPEGAPWWLPYLFTLIGGMVPVVAKRFLAGGSAGDRVRAAQLRSKAARLRAQTPPDMAGAEKCDDAADELEAKAAEKEAAGK